MKRPRPPKPADQSSLVSRLAASTALLAAAVVLLAVVFFQLHGGNFFKGSFQNPLKEWSAMVAARIGDDQTMARAVAKNHQVGVVMRVAGEQIGFGPDGEPADPEELLRESNRFRRIDVSHNGEPRYSFMLDRNAFVDEHNTLLLGLVVLLLVTIGVVYVIQLSQLRPLQWLRSGVDAVSRGDFSTRVPVVSQDEIGQVARAFNQMTRRVERMMDDRERLLADVSHELRSPLARIKVALELLPESDKRAAIARDVRAMEALTTVLLEREKIRNLALQPGKETIDLVALANEVIDGFGVTQPDIALDTPAPELWINADPALVKVLIHNLVDNAVKFSLPDSGPVTVSLQRSGDEVRILIEDDGPGIPAGQTAAVFEPFVKLDPARGHRTGYGLGLNLCQRIVEAHGGAIVINPRQPRGTQLKITLPP